MHELKAFAQDLAAALAIVVFVSGIYIFAAEIAEMVAP